MPAIFAAANKGGGFAITTGPLDVCKVPAPSGFAPSPFMNKAACSGASGTSAKVKIAGKEAFSVKSKVDRSSMDEGGVQKGMVSSKNMDKGTPQDGASKVKVEGAKLVRQTSKFKHNGSSMNTMGVQAKPCQNKVKTC